MKYIPQPLPETYANYRRQYIKKAISQNLPPLRKATKIDGKPCSQDGFAKKAGLTTEGYSSIERGNSPPTVFSLTKIILALYPGRDITLESLIHTERMLSREEFKALKKSA